MKNNYKEALNDIINSKEKNVLECLSSDSYWKKRAQQFKEGLEDIKGLHYNTAEGDVVLGFAIKIAAEVLSALTSPVAETEGQDELWQQVGKIVMDGFDYSNQISVVAMLKDKFFIQPKNK